ncbi:MAG: hypothetical protein ABI678_15225 [Kofleriaceae bacterium]
MIKYATVSVFVVIALACTQHNPAVCEGDGDCTDPARPFCDIDGQYPESSYSPNACSPTPADCPVERCGCTPGETLVCTAGKATVCGADGKSTDEENCALGCSATETRCAAFSPSNGLEGALEEAASGMDFVIPDGSRIDTDLGLVSDAGGVKIDVKTKLVTQDAGQPSILALEGRSFVIGNVTVSGSNAVAFVAPRAITVRGTLDAAARQAQSGPGAQGAGAVCTGKSTLYQSCGGVPPLILYEASGASGGGNATPGGPGGARNATVSPGALVPTFVPLLGGCGGGGVNDETTTALLARGGGGGGAVQLVSLLSVDITGTIVLSGGGGAANMMGAGGGGSGGMLIVEAPSISLRGPGGIAASGGAAGGCNVAGSDGPVNGDPAVNASCGGAGHGGNAVQPPTAGYSCFNNGNSVCACGGAYNGGGGAAGRAHFATPDGGFVTTDSPLIGASVTTASLVIH